MLHSSVGINRLCRLAILSLWSFAVVRDDSMSPLLVVRATAEGGLDEYADHLHSLVLSSKTERYLAINSTQPQFDLQKCYYNILSSANYDDYLTQSEFITFVRLSSNDTFGAVNEWGANITSFSMLPSEFIGMYNLYACGSALIGCPSIEGIEVGGNNLQVADDGDGLLLNICRDIYETVESLNDKLTTSPTTVPGTGVVECPPEYVPGTAYEAGTTVVNSNDGSGDEDGRNYYECKDDPYTPWCSQEAYEPGVGLGWGEAWISVGECGVETVVTGSTTVATTMTTTGTLTSIVATLIPASLATTEAASSVGTTTTDENVAPSLAPVVTPTSKLPTVMITDDPLFTGTLRVNFTYDMGNDMALNAEDIMESDELMKFISDFTTNLTVQVVYDSFGGAQEREVKRQTGDGIVVEQSHSRSFGGIQRGLRLYVRFQRRLEVVFPPGSMAINNLKDINCPSSQPGTVLCQKVFCAVDLVLSNEPKARTELTFLKNLYGAIDDGALRHLESSGIVYTHSSLSSLAVIPEIIDEIPVDGDSGGESKNWVVPVSITVAVVGVLLLSLLAGLLVMKRKRESDRSIFEKSLDDDDDLNNDMVHSGSGHFKIGGERNISRVDLEGDVYSTENPFIQMSSSSESSSEDESSSTEDIDDTPSPDSTRIHHMEDISNLQPYKLPTLQEVSNDRNSDESLESSKSMYRAGVESLLKENCPDQLEHIDDLMNAYEGREEDLIDKLSTMWSATKQSSVPTNESGRSDNSPLVFDSKYSKTLSTSDNGYNREGNDSNVASGQNQSSDSSNSDSSSAGNSEWSTDEGLSSVDASADTDASLLHTTPPSLIAAIGVASNITKQAGIRDDGSISSKSDMDEDQGKVTRTDLNEAIQAGDWSAVSATARLLASIDPVKIDGKLDLSDTSIDSDSSYGQRSLDRASEFAKLVEEGDWEGVMQAAAQYEGTSDTSSLMELRKSLVDDASLDDGDKYKWETLSIEDNPELRTEVESLVRSVVPDELDNIDEMMLQFKGREQDLLNTLRTMQDQKSNTPTTPPNDDDVSPGLTQINPDIFESDSNKSPWWDESSLISSHPNGSERSFSSQSRNSRYDEPRTDKDGF